jgi:hypothetical protein
MKFLIVALVIVSACRSNKAAKPLQRDWTSGANNTQSMQEERRLENSKTTKDQFQTPLPNTNQGPSPL